jgi:hypothetical protein
MCEIQRLFHAKGAAKCTLDIECHHLVSTRGFLHRGKLDIGTDKCRSNNAGVLGCVCGRGISVCCACTEKFQNWVMSSYQESEDILEVDSADNLVQTFKDDEDKLTSVPVSTSSHTGTFLPPWI